MSSDESKPETMPESVCKSHHSGALAILSAYATASAMTLERPNIVNMPDAVKFVGSGRIFQIGFEWGKGK